MSAKKEEPVEVSEEAERARLIGNPRLSLAQERFILTCPAASTEEKATAKDVLMAAVKDKNMAPFYAFLCETYGWMEDEALTASMKAANAAELETLEATIKDAEEELGETEIREAHLAKAEHLSQIGDKDGAISAFRVTTEKTVSLGHKLDIVFHQIRLGMFYGDGDLTVRNLDKAETLMEEGGDWYVVRLCASVGGGGGGSV
jgi:26S proteasome regulatory subunit N7